MAAYGSNTYGNDTYGYTIPVAYTVDPFTAVPLDYSSISIAWVQPSGTITGYRLVRNMSGPSIASDDGLILIDVTSYPGNSFTDIAPQPGRYHYYTFWVLVSGTWQLAGSTGTLMPVNYGSGSQMLLLIPSFYVEAINTTSSLEADTTGNPFLNNFINVQGWGLDYLRTQYDTYLNFNDPVRIPLNDLYSLAKELGIILYPGASAANLRKAIVNNAHINQNRGTPLGIAEEVTSYSGWFTDLTIGPNLMLSDDQSWFVDPNYLTWSANITYNVGEKVHFGNFWYTCISTGNYGNPPTGTSSSNTWWSAILAVTDTTTLFNSNTGGISTWEVIFPSTPNTTPAANTIYEIDGIQDPLNASNFASNGLRIANTSGTTKDMEVRSVARTTAEIATQNVPDKFRTVADGIPVPYTAFSATWSALKEYKPGDIVLYTNQPYVALRASIGSTPPYTSPGTASVDWAPLGFDDRFRFCISAYVQASTAFAATPFVEWYDSAGNYILTLTPRNASSPSTGLPDNVCFDSFTVGAGGTTSGRTTDDGGFTWTSTTGTFGVSPFAGGCLYPTNTATRTIARVTTTSANCQVGLTFTAAPVSGFSVGLMLRYASTTSYFRAGMTQLKKNNGGTITVLGTYSTPFSAGDRMVVTLNGNVITVFRNGSSVLSVTDAQNNTSTSHGIIYETT